MRLTVGPLPSAVYWRRRAMVLGAILVVVMVIAYACGGSSDPDPRAAPPPTTAPATAPPASGEADGGDGEILTPTTGDASGEPGTEPSAGASPSPADPPAAPAPPTGPCSDEEMAVTPLPAKTSVKAGSPIDLRLKIQNTSGRSCSRDVGADAQELRLLRGAETVWSSDHCGSARGSDVRTFAAGAAREYMVTWNGQSSAKCAGGLPSGGPPAAGDYQLIGRLGTRYSQPVKITITA